MAGGCGNRIDAGAIKAMFGKSSFGGIQDSQAGFF